MRKRVIFGWSIYFAGLAIWLYGYFTTGHPSFINWHAYTPRWIADFIPNMESEIGMVLMFASMVPMYWPLGRDAPTTTPRGGLSEILLDVFD